MNKNNLQEELNKGILPIKCDDREIYKKFKNTKFKNNYSVTTDIETVKNSNIILVSINFDFREREINAFKKLRHFFKKIGSLIKKKHFNYSRNNFAPWNYR